ncbi:MAG: nicotinate (nicotinamide) nucleotide adenylyltransferase [Candidatus Coproplasma sp.]
MRFAIFGGAFNPVHKEHINLAKSAVKALKLDKIIIMPSAVSPHKSGKLAVNFWQRYEMCRIAFKDIPQAEVSNYELTQGGVSYTYLTCQHFAKLYPSAERYLIVGADMLDSFPKWKNPQIILSEFKLSACARGDKESFSDYKKKVEKAFNTSVEIIPFVGEKISSTDVRTLASLDEDFSPYVTEDVCKYIKENGLYRLDNLLKVKSMLTSKRWQHSVRVALMCAGNASRIGLEEKRAVTMSALHDCAKYLNEDSQELKGFEFPCGVPDEVMHQFTGAYVAEHTFGISDELILDAIKYHTTGRENMTDAGILLFLCDMLESGRNFEGIDELRKLFKMDLHLCFKEALSHQLDYLQSSGKPIDGLTLKAYNYITR